MSVIFLTAICLGLFNLLKEINCKKLFSFHRACSLWFVVQRTKLCLDFTVTTHFIHLLACWYYNGHFPFAFSWWVLNIACTAIMCVCAEFLCLRTQLKEIPLNVGQKVDL